MKRYAVGIVFVALLLGGLTVGYVVSRDRPEAVVSAALNNLRESRSFFGGATIATQAPSTILVGGADTTVLLPVVLAGNVEFAFPGTEKAQGTAAFTVINPADESGSQDITLEVVMAKDGQTYFRLGNVPAEGGSPLAGELADKWFSMDTRALAGLFVGENASATEPPAGSGLSWDGLMEIVTSGDLFQRPLPLGSQLLGDVPTWHYTLPIRQPALVSLIADAKGLVRGERLNATEEKEIADRLLQRDLRLKVWVDKRTKQFAQADLTIWKLGATEAENQQMGILVNFQGFDKTSTVEAPADALPLIDILQRIREQKEAEAAPAASPAGGQAAPAEQPPPLQ